ncbi:MAG: hypothetical protein NZ891_02185 [bacterium]|nr:hypothetical protein [bacterium]MDW8163534.1 hypothetical protein [Candidatus Omnitrophota bacterium]
MKSQKINKILKKKEFYEKLIKINPNFLEVLFHLVHIHTSLKNYKNVLKYDKKIAKLLNFDPISYYNLACDYSNLGDIENSLKNLKIAILLGFKNTGYIKRDKDLKFLRKNISFKKIEKLLK